MKKLILCVLGTLGFAFPALAYDLAQNGGFEVGSLASWQTFNQGASGGTGSWYAHSSGNGTYSGLPTSPPPSGSWQAVADNSGRAAAILYRDFYIPPTSRAVLSLVLWHGNAAPGGYVNGSSLNPAVTNQRVRIDIISTSSNLLLTTGALQLIYATTSSTPAIVNPTTITQDLTSFAGQTVRLRIALVGTTGGMIAGVDQVKLEVSPFTIVLQQLPGLVYGEAHWGDFDRDGFLDLSYNGYDNVEQKWKVWRFDGTYWTDYSGAIAGISNGGAAIGDLDRDGDLDLAGVGNSPFYANDFLVYRNDGPQAFANILQPGGILTPPGTRYGSIDLGDWDSDGDLDALVTGLYRNFLTESPQTLVQDNFNAGSFSPVFPSLPGSSSGNALWADREHYGMLGVGVCGSSVTEYYAQGPIGTFSSLNYNFPAVTSGAMAIGDLDNDDVDDFVVTGLNGGTPIARIFRGGSSGEMAPLTGVSESAVSLGDYDNDGWLDIALCGSTGSTYVTRIYHNNGNGTFTDIGAGLPGVAYGNVEFGDFEGDGDLDLVVQGQTLGSGPICQVYLNAPPIGNAAPTPPAVLFSGWGGATTPVLQCSYGTDDHTLPGQLSQNFRAGTSPGGVDLISPMSNPTTGVRYLPHPGEARRSLIRFLSMTKLGHGPVYWSVQTVDQCYRGSAWAPEQVFTIGPRISQIQDILGDQGGRVRITLDHSELDDATRTQYPATGYNLWRLVTGAEAEAVARDAVVMDAKAVDEQVSDLTLVQLNQRRFVRSAGVTFANPFPAGTWEIVSSFYATQQNAYTIEASTLADSGMSGPHDQTFIVTVHTTTPSVWFASLPATGRSRDNLAPATPQWVTAAYHTGSGNHLTWEPSTANDLHEYRIHRSTQQNFFPGPGTLVATVTSPEWVDPDHDTPGWYYFICTVDHAGNQSGFAAPDNVTAVDPTTAPLAFGLSAASPNPFAASTRISFALPRATATRLDVFDTGGRLVRTLVDGVVGAGNHEATWDGADRSGQRVKSGVYFYRLRAGSFQSSRRVVVGS